MKNKWKKTLAVLMATFAFVGCFSGCNFGGGSSQSEESTSQESSGSEEKEVVKTLLEAQNKQSIDPEETLKYDIDEDIEGLEYFGIDVKTNVHLLGEITYCDLENSNKVVTEEFFVEASDGEKVEFRQFLDKFRPNGVGQFEKKLLEVTLTNKSEEAGEITVEGVTISSRVIPDYEKEVYIEKDNLKVGADLAVGGTLTYLERTTYLDNSGVEQTVDEVITDDDRVYIGVNAKENAKETLSSNVNLINIFDAGRQIQQSYYANVGGTMQSTNGENGYTRAMCTTADEDGYYWPYNPVQGGDCACNTSQIIDYQVSKNEIYVKVRAMDWAKGDDGRGLEGTIRGGSTTKSYIENWYSIKSGMLFVENRFVDWNGFTDMHTVPAHSNELPATYISHPLNNYVCYTGQNPWNDEPCEVQSQLGNWAQGAHPNTVHKEDWFAWVNDENFGVGMYIPGTISFASGRSNASTDRNYKLNRDALDSPLADELQFKFNKPAATYDEMSCYTRNTSYTAPVVSWTMQTYEPMFYEYVVSVDYVSVMREQFKYIYESGELTNETLSAWN